MEIEAWFIQKSAHFLNLNSSLTPERIENDTGFNPDKNNAVDINHPSELLDQIYNLVELEYEKKAYQVHTTTDYLDYEELYINVRSTIPQLNHYIKEIETAIS